MDARQPVHQLFLSARSLSHIHTCAHIQPTKYCTLQTYMGFKPSCVMVGKDQTKEAPADAGKKGADAGKKDASAGDSKPNSDGTSQNSADVDSVPEVEVCGKLPDKFTTADGRGVNVEQKGDDGSTQLIEIPLNQITHAFKAFTQKCKDDQKMILDVADCASVLTG